MLQSLPAQPPKGANSSLLRPLHSTPPPAQGPVPSYTHQFISHEVPNNGPLKFDWRRCNNMPENMYSFCSQPAVLNDKLYFKCISKIDGKFILLEYTPSLDLWKFLLIPPIPQFSLAILEGHLIAIGERKKSFGLRSEIAIFIFDVSCGKWALSKYPTMPSDYAFSESTSVILGSYNHLIIAGGKRFYRFHIKCQHFEY